MSDAASDAIKSELIEKEQMKLFMEYHNESTTKDRKEEIEKYIWGKWLKTINDLKYDLFPHILFRR